MHSNLKQNAMNPNYSNQRIETTGVLYYHRSHYYHYQSLLLLLLLLES